MLYPTQQEERESTMSEENGYRDGLLANDDLGSLEPMFVNRTIGGKNYILREPAESVKIRWQRATMRTVTMTDGKFAGLEGAAEAESILVAGCLFELCTPPETGERPVAETTVRGWVSRITSRLYDDLHKMCPHLKGEDTEESLTKEIDRLTKRRETVRTSKESSAKNSPSSSMDTSVTVSS